MRAGAVLAGRYRLEALLGRGAAGEVWRGVDENLDRRVAIRLLLANLLGDDRLTVEALGRFRREATAAARLDHRNITGIHDLGEHREDRGDGLERVYPFLVLEFVDGPDLRAVREPSVEHVLAYGLQACEALAAAHAAGIVHRDVKPSNLMIASDGTLKVCDFGVARLDGLPDVPPHADLHALGSVLRHLLTGHAAVPAELEAFVNTLLTASSSAADAAAALRGLPRAEAEHEIAQLRAAAEREIVRHRAAAERERDEILAEARKLAEEMQARAQRVLVEAEAAAAGAQLPTPVQFDVVLRGYDRDQVDDYVRERLPADEPPPGEGPPFDIVLRGYDRGQVAEHLTLHGHPVPRQGTPLSAPVEFDVALRGYDRHQVDDYLRRHVIGGEPARRGPVFDVVLRGYDRDQVAEHLVTRGHPDPRD